MFACGNIRDQGSSVERACNDKWEITNPVSACSVHIRKHNAKENFPLGAIYYASCDLNQNINEFNNCIM